jgi:hypothetical protein
VTLMMTGCYRSTAGVRRAGSAAISLFLIVPLAILSSSAPRASAAFIGAKIEVNVTSELGNKTYDVGVTSTGDTFDWTLASPVALWDGGNLLGTIKELQVSLDGDPNAFVFFSVQAGNVPTNFSVSSALVSFAPIIGSLGSASGGVTVTDTSGNGATLTGNFAGANSFQAEYNNGVIFASLVQPALAPGLTSTQSGSLVNVPMPPVFNIQSKFDFTLSPNDIGSGTGNFTVTPEPSSLVLAAVGATGLAYFARRRRKA